MKKLLALVAVGAIAFGIVGAAAATLTTTNDGNGSGPLPQTGSVPVISKCAASATISYNYDESMTKVTSIHVAVVQNTPGTAVVVDPAADAVIGSCAGQNVALTATGVTGTIQAAQKFEESGIVTAFDFKLNTDQGEAIALFAPTAFAVTIYK
ncbi:MAG: hypothetical protein WCK58_11405 [Chloroflexota bacterium]